MIKSIEAMKNSPKYLKEMEEWEALDTDLPEKEEEGWWSKTES